MSTSTNLNYNIAQIFTENFNGLIYVLNSEFICEYVNEPVHNKILGYSLLTKKMQDTIHFADLKRANKFFNEILKYGEGTEQLRIKVQNNYAFYKFDGTKFFDKNNNIKVILIGTDISNYIALENEWAEREKNLRKLAESMPEIRFWKLLQTKSEKTSFQKSREMLDLVIDNIPHFVYWKNRNFEYVGCNENYALINNLENPNYIIGKSDEQLSWAKLNYQKLYESEKNVMETNQSEEKIEIWENTMGDVEYYEVNRIPLQNLNQNVVGILCTYNNITNRIIAEQKLKASEQKYRSILENIKEGYFEVDLRGSITFCNDYLSEIMGYPKNELLNKNYKFLTDDYNQKKVFELFNQVFNTEEGVRYFQFEFFNSKSEKIIVETSVNLRYDQIGEIIGFYGIVHDITEKYQLEQQLKLSEEKYRHLFDKSPFVVWLLDLKGNVIDCNETTNRLLSRYTKQDLIGKNYIKILSLFERPDYFIPFFKEKFDGFIKDERLKPVEFRMSRDDGKKLWLMIQSSKIKLGLETLIYVIIQDITEKKEAELRLQKSDEELRILNKKLEQLVSERTKELRESEEKFRHLYQNSPYGITLLDTNGIIIDINSTISLLFGYTKEDLIGKNYLNLFGVYPEETKSAIRTINQLMTRGNKREDFYKPKITQILKKDGSKAWIESEISIINVGAGNLIQAIIQDITEKRVAEEKLKESEKLLREQNIELKELDRLKTDFISIAAHELKTPLISIGGYIDLILLREKELKQEIKEDLERALNNVHRLEEYINKLLDIMKIDAKKMQLVKQNEKIHTIIKNSLLELEFQIQQKNIKVTVNVPTNLELKIDSFRIGQVFLNIISNAVRFISEQGLIEISLIETGKFYTFKVKDNGKGLTQEEKQKLFGKFVTLGLGADNFSTFDKGSGLGLYIAKGIIEAHGGEIWVQSDGIGKGAEFCFTLPKN